jgi:L-rhamnose mutarotase
MKVFAQALDLKDDPRLIAEYKEHHRSVWPEVAAALRGAGIASMRIFLTGNRLFMTFEAPDDFDPARDFQKYAANPKCREWDELMRRYQQRVPSATPGGWWEPMEEVFDLSWRTEQP